MSDSSEDEDLSKFRDAVDNSFASNLSKPSNDSQKEIPSKKSLRYLEESSHYNDVKVPEAMANQIGAKVSAIIEKTVKFVDVELKAVKRKKLKGGVKLFSDSSELLTADAAVDTYTDAHNQMSKKLRENRKHRLTDDDMDEQEKVKSVAVDSEYVISKKEIKLWRSRRKEKLFKYKSKNKSNVLVAVE